jgi:hypothetical protein
MHALLLGAVLGLLGDEVGWQKTDDGQMEFVLQFTAEELDAIQRGEKFRAVVPPEIKRIDSYLVKRGRGGLPRQPSLAELKAPSATIDALAQRPWLPVALGLALLGSFGANLYFGWVTWETRARYRSLLRGKGPSEGGDGEFGDEMERGED